MVIGLIRDEHRGVASEGDTANRPDFCRLSHAHEEMKNGYAYRYSGGKSRACSKFVLSGIWRVKGRHAGVAIDGPD